MSDPGSRHHRKRPIPEDSIHPSPASPTLPSSISSSKRAMWSVESNQGSGNAQPHHKSSDGIVDTGVFPSGRDRVFCLYENESVAQVAHFKGHLKKLSGCNTMPYEIYYLVRNEELHAARLYRNGRSKVSASVHCSPLQSSVRR